ncbi:HAD family hydrolase [Pelotomaculum sp. FP]|uniref:HAD family hydrolase n=1 Tax=Pelotomaculum sp. FP TaxID=261474 RepID=UPI001064C7BF|nr:HAD family hydrolase [Pelotomaculum sp. FP]
MGDVEVLQVVLFDLDGTLLPMDHRKFMNEYLKELSLFVRPVIEPDAFKQALMASTSAMAANNSLVFTNEEVFWKDFENHLGERLPSIRPLLEMFYAEKFRQLSYVAHPCPEARILVKAAMERNLRIALATNPLFPLTAIQSRMSWADVDDFPWNLITSYEVMHFCKPHPGYYREIAAHLGVRPEECLMVGNNVDEDLVAGTLGMKTYLVTDCLLGDPAGICRADWHGSIQRLAWLWENQGIPGE